MHLSMFLNQSDLDDVKSWVDKNKINFVSNGFARSFYMFDKNTLPAFIKGIKDQIELHYKIPKGSHQEPCYKDFIGYITNGGQIHRHKDPNKGDLMHTRFNILISKPLDGGNPIINEKILNVSESESWVCVAGKYEHFCQKVLGEKPRIVLSFGYLLSDIKI